MIVHDEAGLVRILRDTRTIAVLGARAVEWAAGHYVPAYLAGQGYRVFPVNPMHRGTALFGERCVATLAELPEPVDLIDVFRRPETLVPHAREILALPWRPRVVWFQLGIENDEAATMLSDAGIDVVQDRCMMPEHRRLIGAGARAAATRR